jgi:hypothetical protein
MSRARLSFYEFFAGGGMARLGLGEAWACAFANDFDRRRPTASPGQNKSRTSGANPITSPE